MESNTPDKGNVLRISDATSDIPPAYARHISAEQERSTTEAFADFGATLFKGYGVHLEGAAEPTEAPKPEKNPLKMDLYELLLEHADQSRQNWKYAASTTSGSIRSHATTPANLIAVGSEKIRQKFGPQRTSFARVQSLMEKLGLSDAWKPNPTIEDIVPYCDLDDVMAWALPDIKDQEKLYVSVTTLLAMKHSVLSMKLTDGKSRDSYRARQLRTKVNKYIKEFNQAKSQYQQNGH